MYIVGGLILAWFLSLFDIDEILVGAINEIFRTDHSTNVYYLFFFSAALVFEIIQFIRNKGFNYD